MLKALVIRAVVVLAVVTGITVSAEAQPVELETVSAVSSISLTVASSTSAVGVLGK